MRAGGVRQPHPQPGRRHAQPAQALRLLPVRHGLYTNLEVGQGGQR